MKKIKLLALLSVLISSAIYGDIKLDSSKLQNTTIEQGKRGNAIININTPNGKGISVNDFENFQTKNGVVFNNSGQRMNISQLEGIINGNPNITGDQAKLILNRVNGTSRTEIEGVMEAVGRNKVDMIFSSPKGIYLNGAKFIGFKDVTFTTAPVSLDGNGNIRTLTIVNGKTEIGKSGLDASKLEQLALLSKEISIDGKINGNSLNLIAGDFDYNIYNNSYTKKYLGNGGMPLSLNELGSIYGNQISMIVTNGDIGVKGDVLANSNVKLEAQETVYIYVKGSVGANNLVDIKKFDNQGYIYSGEKIIFKTGKGKGNITSGSFEGENFNNSGNLITKKINIQGNLVNHGNAIIKSDNDILINVKGTFTNHSIVTAKNIEIESGKFHNSYKLNPQVKATKNLIIKSNGEVTNFGVLSGVNLYINSSDLVLTDKASHIIGLEGVNIEGKKIVNNGYINSKNLKLSGLEFENMGSLKAEENMELKAKKIIHSGKIETNTLKIIKNNMSSTGSIIFNEISFENYTE